MNATLLIELRVEELPPSMCRPALEGLEKGVLGLLEGVRRGAVHTFATPRRLAVVIEDLAPARPPTESIVTGPPAERAFDADGQPTSVAEGFARGKGVDVSALEVVELPKRGRVVAARVQEGGERVVACVAEGLSAVIAAIPFSRTMTWGAGDGLAFGRPLRGILAVYDGEVIPGAAHGLPFIGETVGHRLYPQPLRPTDLTSYVHGLRARFVEPEISVRAGRIRSLLDDASDELGADPIADAELEEELLWLVEWPVRILGRFDADLLSLPPRLLITSMKVHQRYLPVHRGGELTEHFVVIGNNPDADAEVVAEGNARVLRARFHDARFFFAEDQATGLTAFAEKLGSMRWIRGLGTMGHKAGRLGSLGARLSPGFGADPAVVAWAARWAKADLPSRMVGEFPELQGHMGAIYARALSDAPQGGPDAIEAHYLPRFAGDALPASAAGAVLALAERIDTLVGCFGIGVRPSSGGDPQGLRRAASGVVAILLDRGWRGEIGGLFDAGLAVFEAEVQTLGADGALPFDRWLAAKRDAVDLVAELSEFLIARYRAFRLETGGSADVVDAVLATAPASSRVDLALVDRVVRALASRRGSEELEQLLTLAKRVANIAGDAEAVELLRGDLPAGEARLADATATLTGALDRCLGQAEPDLDGALEAVLAAGRPIAAFFDEVLVNDPSDPEGTTRRLSLLAAMRAQLYRLADFSRISTR